MNGRAVFAFIRLGRPLFLGGGFLLYALGAAIARWQGHPIDVSRYLLGQLVVTSFQWMTHYMNDYFDYEADVANESPTRWSGGSRVLVDGELPRSTALSAGIVLAVIGSIASVALFMVAGAWSALTCLVMLVLAFEYSAPPLRLCASGAGEVNTALVVTGLVPWLAFLVQAPDLRGAGLLVIAIVPLALLQLAMMLAIEFPDAVGDARAGKRTLVVRLGAARSAKLYAAVTAAAYLWLPVGYLLGLPARVVLAGLVPAPVAIWRMLRIAEHREPVAFERLTFFSVFLLMTTTLGELVAFASI